VLILAPIVTPSLFSDATTISWVVWLALHSKSFLVFLTARLALNYLIQQTGGGNFQLL
jgi:hypothetical protein